jgi:DNA polymerase
MKVLHIDFETRSRLILGGSKSVGLWNYANDSSTEILMLAWKYQGEEPRLWQPHLGAMSEELSKALVNPKQQLSAFNSAFERYVLQYKLGIVVPPSRFIDPQVGARYLSLPASLEEVGEILGLPEHLAKDKKGESLIKLFCEPHLSRKKKGEEQTSSFNDWTSHPEDWKAFGEYCKKDTIAEEEVSRRIEILEALPLPLFERRLWELDQLINDRGIPIDVQFVTSAYKLSLRAKDEALKAQNVITGLDNSNSTSQLLPWCKERGYTYNTLNKSFVDAALKDPEMMLTDECRKVLTARREAASTSYTKLATILRQVNKHGRLCHQFIFMGSSRCGRWSGGSSQPHNMARPIVIGRSEQNPDGFDFENQDIVIEARELVRGEKYDKIVAKFGGVLAVVKNLIRTAFACD